MEVFSIESLFAFIGRAVCHQLPERSFFVFGHKLPLCARCTGIYISITACILFLSVLKRFSGNTPVKLRFAFVILGSMTFLAYDGLSSYLGMRDTNNIIRLATGLLFGYGLPVFYVFLYNFTPEEDNYIPVIESLRELFIIITASFLLSAFIFVNNAFIWFVLSVIVCFGIFAVIFSVIRLILKLILSKASKRLINAICICSSLLIIYIFSSINYFLLKGINL